MKTQTWLEDVYAKITPAIQAVYDRRKEIQTLRDKRNLIIGERAQLEIAEKKAHVAVTDDPTLENFTAWVAAREKLKSWQEAETLMQQMSTHFSESLEGHHCGAEEILEPALKEVAERVKAKIDEIVAQENKRLTAHGLVPAESPAVEPLRKYYGELTNAISNLCDWSEANIQSAWRRWNHLIK